MAATYCDMFYFPGERLRSKAATNVERDLGSFRHRYKWDNNKRSRQVIRFVLILLSQSRHILIESDTEADEAAAWQLTKNKQTNTDTTEEDKSVTCQVVCRTKWWIRPFRGCWHSRSRPPGFLSPSGLILWPAPRPAPPAWRRTDNRIHQ